MKQRRWRRDWLVYGQRAVARRVVRRAGGWKGKGASRSAAALLVAAGAAGSAADAHAVRPARPGGAGPCNAAGEVVGEWTAPGPPHARRLAPLTRTWPLLRSADGVRSPGPVLDAAPDAAPGDGVTWRRSTPRPGPSLLLASLPHAGPVSTTVSALDGQPPRRPASRRPAWCSRWPWPPSPRPLGVTKSHPLSPAAQSTPEPRRLLESWPTR